MRSATVRQLQIFSVAASHLSFARAAEKLHLTHAAISLQIKQLEDVCGTQLFDRIGKKVFLTEAGDILLDHARQILQSLKDADESLMALKGLKGGRVTIAVTSTAEYFAPGLLAAFRKAHPDVRVRLLVQNREDVARGQDQRRERVVVGEFDARGTNGQRRGQRVVETRGDAGGRCAVALTVAGLRTAVRISLRQNAR